jgi:hypothetical protein
VCGASKLASVTGRRVVHVVCHACNSVFDVEFYPPDEESLRGRITLIARGDPIERTRDEH